MTGNAARTTELRALRYLGNGGATVGEAADPSLLLLAGEGRAPIAVGKAILADLLRRRLISRQNGRLVLAASQENPLLAGSIEIVRRETPHGIESVQVDTAESPLAQLRRLRGKDGHAFLSMAEWRAGERLRSDYTRGQIMPRLSANWETSVASGRRSACVADLTDAALAARTRVRHAVEAIGPELSGLLVDVCCFLKGLEQVEAERELPRRSANVLLKAGLAILARHYEPATACRQMPLHWGTDDYRPSMTPAP